MKNLNGKVSIIMPAHNEEKRIVSSIQETIGTFDDFGCDYEIIVIDDGSKDNTYHEAMKLASRYNNVMIKHNRLNYGKGRALKKGFQSATGDFVVFLDADMDLHPAQISTFFDIMRLDDADVVIGSKRHPNSKLEYPLHRKFISSSYFFLIKLLFGMSINDTQTGLKLFKYKALKGSFKRILVKKFAFDLELLVNIYHLGYKITEAPVVLNHQREFGRIGIRAIFVTFLDTMAIWYRMYILRYYDRIDYYRRKGLLREFKRVRK